MHVRFSMTLATLVAAAALSSCGAPGLPAKATVTMIDRKCTIIETVESDIDDPRAKGHSLRASESSTKKGECKSVEEWEQVRKKRSKQVDGTAVVHVDYSAPQDGSSHSGTLTFTGRDDEFYALNAGDSLDILVAKNDPTRIRKA